MMEIIEWCIINEQGLYLQNELTGTSNDYVTYTNNFNNRQRFYSLEEVELVNSNQNINQKINEVKINISEVVNNETTKS